MIKKYCIIIFTYIFYTVLCQDLPSVFFIEDRLNILHDFGYTWNKNKILKPYQWSDFSDNNFFLNDDSLEKSYFNNSEKIWYLNQIYDDVKIYKNRNKEDNLSVKIFSGYHNSLRSRNQSSHNFYAYFNIYFKENIRAWFNPRITTNKNYLNNFSGEIQQNERFGFNSGEVDKSGFGYFSNNLNMWYGRGRKNWGSLALNNIALSNNSASFDHLSSEFNSRNYSFKYFHGFLESINDGYNRYIVGKGFEYSNNSNFILGLHEVVIYGGNYRQIDMSYLNPLSSHLEVELNSRDNDTYGSGSQNAIWQISTDFILSNLFRISTNFLLDEIALDDKNINRITNDTTDATNHLGFQIRLAYSSVLFNNYATTLFFENTTVGSFTLRHERGQNNFTSRNKPLGSNAGSDCINSRIGLRIITPNKIIINLEAVNNKYGEENINNNLYIPLDMDIKLYDSFPLGKVVSYREFNIDFNYMLSSKLNINVISKNHFSNDHKNISEINLNLNLNFNFNRHYSI